jgi:DNA-directed RNA polymerase specialized sigma24 family protein
MSTKPAACEQEPEGILAPVAAPAEDGTRRARWGTLLDRVAQGDVDACGSFYDESSGLAFTLILHIVRDRQAAEDALLELYTRVWTLAREQAHRDRHPVAWLISLARHSAVTKLRRFSPSNPSLLAFEPFRL